MTEKSETLKARVSLAEKREFERICTALGRKPSDLLRELVSNFVSAYSQLQEDQVQIDIWRPEGYDFGAWRVSIALRNAGSRWGTIFQLPELKNRRLYSDPEYRGIWNSGDGKLGLGGCFVDGVWRGHLYTNGVSEAENPTSLQTVKEALRRLIEPMLSTFPPQATGTNVQLDGSL